VLALQSSPSARQATGLIVVENTCPTFRNTSQLLSPAEQVCDGSMQNPAGVETKSSLPLIGPLSPSSVLPE